MATTHSLNSVQDQWRLIDRGANMSSLGKIHEPSGHTVAELFAATIAEGVYAACVWEDSDSDLRMTVYDRVNEEEDTLEFAGESHERAFVEPVGSDHFLLYAADTLNTQWVVYLCKYDPLGSPNKLTVVDSVNVSSQAAGQPRYHAMTVLSDTLAVVSYVSNSTGNIVSAHQIDIDIGAGTVAINGTNTAQALPQLDNKWHSFAKIDSTRAVYYEGPNDAGVLTVTAGTSIVTATSTSLHAVSNVPHNNLRPAVSDDGAVVGLTSVDADATSPWGVFGCGTISGTTVTASGALQSTDRPNLLHGDGTAGPEPTAQGYSCIFLRKENDFYCFAVVGNLRDPATASNVIGMIVATKGTGDQIAYGGVFTPESNPNVLPVMARASSDVFLFFSLDSDGDLIATEVSRIPY